MYVVGFYVLDLSKNISRRNRPSCMDASTSQDIGVASNKI